MLTVAPPEIFASVPEMSGSLTTISRTAPPCKYSVLTDNIPSEVPKSDAAKGIKLGAAMVIPPANIIAIIVRLVNLRPILLFLLFMLLQFLSNFSI